jgi:hypothetical protein
MSRDDRQILTYTRGDGTFVQRVPTGVALPVTITPFNDLFYGKMVHRVEPLGEGETKNVGDMQSPDDFLLRPGMGKHQDPERRRRQSHFLPEPGRLHGPCTARCVVHGEPARQYVHTMKVYTMRVT